MASVSNASVNDFLIFPFFDIMLSAIFSPLIAVIAAPNEVSVGMALLLMVLTHFRMASWLSLIQPAIDFITLSNLLPLSPIAAPSTSVPIAWMMSPTPLVIAVVALAIEVCSPPVAFLACSAKLGKPPSPVSFSLIMALLKSSMVILPAFIALYSPCPLAL